MSPTENEVKSPESFLSCPSELVQNLDYEFQPIVHIYTGETLGFEALLRKVETIGFDSISHFLDTVWEKGKMNEMELLLFHTACRKFRENGLKDHLKLFFNVDSKSIPASARWGRRLLKTAHDHGFSTSQLCMEISERHHTNTPDELVKTVHQLANEGLRIALDDFGTGICGARSLFQLDPTLMKIDRFFIKDMNDDPKKRLFVSHLVQLAHAASVQVIAEGVETKQEFFLCREVGCDYVQGYWVQRPTAQASNLRREYAVVKELNEWDRREKTDDDSDLIIQNIEYLPAASNSWNGRVLLKFLNSHPDQDLFPVLNNEDEPLGVINKKDISDLLYSPFGKALLVNPGTINKPHAFITKCPVVDIHTPAEKVLELYNMAEKPAGVLFVQNMKYEGFLRPEALLRIFYERNLRLARDQNPLSKLPGNLLVHEYVSKALRQTELSYTLVYFDMMDFKPFNDTYGFRVGDRALILFSDILKKECHGQELFVGHIGGDDFFLGCEGYLFEDARPVIQRILARFRSEAESLYPPEDRRKGHIRARDRDGRTRKFALLSVRAGVIELCQRADRPPYEEFMRLMAELKSEAKIKESQIALATFS